MTIIAVLGTGFSEEEVCDLMRILGFEGCRRDDPLVYRGVFEHYSVQNLRVQVHHIPSYLRGVEGVVTEMEFETKGIAPTEEMLDVLRDMHRRMPDLVYCMSYALLQKKTPVRPLEHFFENLG
ncbi:hypothetical protein JW707_02705 [Candidatus Woesearchaeota archaeon]|nr:hypothetical protein [Candidatus Woesearchaeota archaeon]